LIDEHESDAALWLSASSGTERAFVVIFDRYRSRIFGAAYRRTNRVSDAEEIVAMVFLEAWRLRKRVRIVDGTLLPVTSNLSRSQRRYARMIARLPLPVEQDDHAPSVDERVDGRPCRRALDDAINSLSAGDRAVVELCLVEELPLADAAAALEVPVGTVKSRLHRARKQQQAKLAVAEPDELFATQATEEVA
jgi:RNA polymerase sigma factor (sigma-70 family)